jgi:hypothetical protein
MEQIPKDTNYQFIREKIYRLHSAIMYSMSNELIKIPNSIITVLRIDDEGHLWFQCKAPVHHIQHYEQSFPARLHFFRKGVRYFMEVSGSTAIIRSQDSNNIINGTKEAALLLKMNINSVAYVEPEARKKNRFEHFFENAFNWVLHAIPIPRSSKSFLTKLQHNNR